MVAVLVSIVCGSSPPRLGKTMLDVTAGDDHTRRGKLIPSIAVHIHTIAVFVLVGIIEDLPRRVGSIPVRNGCVVTNQFFECAFEFTVFESVGGVIETFGQFLGAEAEGQETEYRIQNFSHGVMGYLVWSNHSRQRVRSRGSS